MKNETNKPSQAKHPSDEPQWREESVRLSRVIQHKPFQVRRGLNKDAVKRYTEMTAFGKEPPPIKVARVGSKLYLIDGWHRIAAGALRLSKSVEHDEDEVWCLIADMTIQQARWQAAKANTEHGVPLKNAEIKAVFIAFVKSGHHIKPNGKWMSYREIAGIIGKPHRTIHEWMQRHFPATAAKMGGKELGNPNGDAPKMPLITEEEAHRLQAEEALLSLVQHGTALESPENRWGILQQLERLSNDLRSLGVLQPDF